MATATPALVPLGKVIDEMFDLREKKRELEAKVKIIETQIAASEEILLTRLGEQGLDASKGKKASVSITSTTVGNLVDRAALEAFVKKSGHFQLFQARISDPAFRELLALRKGKAIPGLEEFTKKRINLRVISST